MNKNVCVIDYGAGNLRSVCNALRSFNVTVSISSELKYIREASHLVLPGVGSFSSVVSMIRALPAFNEIEHEVVKVGKPFLGICIGMQVLADTGEEYGHHAGLAWIPGSVKRLNTNGLVLPHIGWNNFRTSKTDRLLGGITNEMDFYYVHSYHFEGAVDSHRIATCEYGMEFTAVIRKDNIYGVQFHPEKSQKSGHKILENFLRLS